MAKFMLLLHDNPGSFTAMGPEQMQKTIEKYMAWSNRLRQAGLMHGSDKLKDEPGKVLRGKNGKLRVTDGPYSETKEVLGGYFVIEADSYEQAIERSRDCPHLEYGGTIEVRQVDVIR
jgi:hypothetical protein